MYFEGVAHCDCAAVPSVLEVVLYMQAKRGRKSVGRATAVCRVRVRKIEVELLAWKSHLRANAVSSASQSAAASPSTAHQQRSRVQQ